MILWLNIHREGGIMEFDWTQEEANSVINILQLIGVAGARIQYNPILIPSDKEVLDIKSAFRKMAKVMLDRRLKGE